MSSDAVPDPEDVMEAEYHDQIADEPIDDFDVDVGNANLEEDFHDREGTPIPEEAVPAANHIGEIDIINYADVRTDSIISVCNPAVDIEFLCQTYTGHALLSRLQFICDHCPPLKRDAIIGMINELHKNSLNVARYTALHAQLEFLEKHPHEQCHLEAPVCDQLWVDHTTVKASGRLDFLLSEYKKQKDEGVKESTRRAMEDLFQHYLAVGQVMDALRLYSRGMREYCSQFKHIIQMWLNWMEASIYVGEWQRVDTIYTQAERSMKDAEESESVASNNASRAGRPVVIGVGASKPTITKSTKQLINGGRAKIDAANGLSKLQQGRYKAAADKVLKVDVDHIEMPWLFSGSDLAVYGTLCAVATYDRADIKKKVIGDTTCRKFLEAEPKLVDLLQSFTKSQFGKSLDVMQELKDRFLLDPYLSAHVEPLYKLIRDRAIVQYLTPFASADLRTMAEVFRTDVSGLENELVGLCERGVLNARIDSIGGTVRTVDCNEREDTYRKIVGVCDNLIERVESAILRAVMQQGRISIQCEGRGKRKTAQHSDDASDPANIPNRQKVSVQNMMRALRGRPQITPNLAVAHPSEADSSEGSEDPKEPDMN